VSTEESRPILNGVLWELRDGEMKMVATNGHRLARMGMRVPSTGTPSADFIVPPAALSQVQRLFKDDDTIEVARSDNHLGFRASATEVYTRLIENSSSPPRRVTTCGRDHMVNGDHESVWLPAWTRAYSGWAWNTLIFITITAQTRKLRWKRRWALWTM
jgi:DNA polymerase-3 subunit beta